MAGDFNATLLEEERWGVHSRPNLLDDKLFGPFNGHHMRDIYLIPISLTWSHRRVGDEYIGKQLDKFFIKEQLDD